MFSSAIDEAVEEALHPPKPQKSRDSAKKHGGQEGRAAEERQGQEGGARSRASTDGKSSPAKAETSAAQPQA